MKLRKLNTLYNYLSAKLGCHPLFVSTELIRWSDSLEFCVWPQQNDLYFPCLIYDHKTISLSYRSFVSCRTWLSQIFSYIIQLRKKKSRQGVVNHTTNFIIRNYIKFSWNQNNGYVSKNPKLLSSFLHGKKGWKYQKFSGVQKHNYHSDLNWKLYIVTCYKVTSLYRELFFLNSIIK